MSTTFEIGRIPAAFRRALSQSGEGPTLTSWKTRAVKRGQRSSSSIVIVIQSAVSRSPSAGGSLSSSGARSMPKIACTSRATPRIESRSARFEVTSSSSTSCASGMRDASGSPGFQPSPSTMIPSPSGEMSSSRSDRIMPSEVSPRSFERAMRRPSSSTVPGSATATVSPASKFQAPHTIWPRRGLPHVDLAELQAVGVRVLAGLEHEPGDDQLLDAVLGRKAAALDALDLVTGEREPSGELVQGRQLGEMVRQPLQRDLHRTAPRNCSRKRTSLS